MKTFFLSLLFAVGTSLSSEAQTVTIDQGKLETPRGIGGYDEVAYAFAKGDVVTVTADADKLLERIMVTLYPSNVLKRVKYTKGATTTFTVPEEGIVLIRFISDRAGGNTVRYTVTRTPGPGTPADYNTKVEWVKPTTTYGALIPKRAGQ